MNRTQWPGGLVIMTFLIVVGWVLTTALKALAPGY